MAQLLQAFESPPLRATPVPDLDPRALNLGAAAAGHDEPPSTRPLSGPGSSRQTRRLQLRNAGFRGASIPSRKLTPKSESTTSAGRSSRSGGHSGGGGGGGGGASDLENISPTGTDSSSDKRWSNSFQFHHSGAATLKHSRSKGHSRRTSRPLGQMPYEYDDALHDLPGSPNSTKGHTRTRTVKSRVKVSHNRRRSLSAEANRYIEHLELQLADAQAQLSAAAAASTSAVEKPSKVRALTIETQHLRDELESWEEMFDERMQEELDRHHLVEGGLRQQVETMERDTDEMRIRVEELKEELHAANDKLQAVEGANILLEKRVEMMSELLAASKIDLYAGTPAARDRRHSRLKSLLPRFPTAKSLGASPERQILTQPSSPAMMSTGSYSYTAVGGSPMSPPHRDGSSSDTSPRPPQSSSEFMSDSDSVFSEAFTAGDSMTSVEQLEGSSSLNAWGIPVINQPKPKPARRMRKFVAGSVGPKPLILPSTNHHNYFGPISAPPLERRGTSPAFFPELTHKFPEFAVSPGRRRSSTTADQIGLANLSFSPTSTSPVNNNDRRVASHQDRPMSVDSHASAATRRAYSISSPPGRSLMDELNAAWTSGSNASGSSDGHAHDEAMGQQVWRISPVPGRSRRTSVAVDLILAPSASLIVENTTSEPVVMESVVFAETSDAESDDNSSERSPVNETPAGTRKSLLFKTSLSSLPFGILARIQLLFWDLWSLPIPSLARHLIQTAREQLRVSESLQTVQWWLVGVLLGPMAKKRMIARERCCSVSSPKPSPASRPSTSTSHHSASPSISGNSALHNRAVSTATAIQSTEHTKILRRTDVLQVPDRARRAQIRRHQCPACRDSSNSLSKHSPWLWLKFSLTLAFAIGSAFCEGPGSLLHPSHGCLCTINKRSRERGAVKVE